jgi:hypothetical protein
VKRERFSDFTLRRQAGQEVRTFGAVRGEVEQAASGGRLYIGDPNGCGGAIFTQSYSHPPPLRPLAGRGSLRCRKARRIAGCSNSLADGAAPALMNRGQLRNAVRCSEAHFKQSRIGNPLST